MDDRLHILVIEDDRVYAEFVGTTLREAGHNVVVASSGTAARDEARKTVPDAVILDLGLPDESGYDVARALRRDLLPDTSVIILLTADLFPQRDLADAVGIDVVLSKPVEPALVRGMIDHVRARRTRRLRPDTK